MPIVTLPASAPTSYQSLPTENPDAEFERRWSAWKARGVTHERAVRQRFLSVAIVTVVIAVAALIAYALLSS